MILNGRLAELLVHIDPKLYWKCVVIEKFVEVFYVRVQNALYILLHRLLLFYPELVMDMKKNGFSLNPYNPYVANKLVNG